MKRLSVLILLSMLTAAAAQAADEQERRMDQGQSGCDSFTWNMSREFDLLRATPIALNALATRSPEMGYVPLDRRLDLTLLPGKQVKLPEKPGRDPGADTYAGLLLLRVSRTSIYRISSDQRLRIDVIGPGGVVKSSKFEMQPGCDKLHKTVAFSLEPQTDYWIQLSGSPAAQAVLLITLDH